ncbi:hypothetical protein F5Y14DRAFT_450031 [Nemania sp. NC0429]|nr:hypothetical protein F5Y14DRAFT_450031 [Nemania sp. NC0429]
MSPAARDFIIATSAFHSSSSPAWKDQTELRMHFAEATSVHSRDISAASRGHEPDLKIGFMRVGHDGDEDEGSSSSSVTMRRGEAGFLVHRDRGIYVDCNVLGTHAQFAISGKPAYVGEVGRAFARAVEVVVTILDLGTK